MNEPRRMREEGGSALERALLEAGRSSGASPHTRARTLAALGLAAGPLVVAAAPTQAAGVIAAASEAAPVPVAASATAATLTTATKIGLTTTLAKVVVGVTLAGAVAAVPLGTVAWRRAHAPVAATSTESGIATAMPAPPAPTEATVKAETTTPTTSAKSLSRELAALDTARLRLAKGDVSGAVAVLDDYERKFPQGRMAMEAEVLHIDALARAGRTEAARTRAAAFLRSHPGSVLASRVRQYLGD